MLNIASIAGVLGLKNRIAYSATKAGVVGMTKAMAFSSASMASASTRSGRA